MQESKLLLSDFLTTYYISNAGIIYCLKFNNYDLSVYDKS